MKSDDLLDAIGMINDYSIINAKKKPAASKSVWVKGSSIILSIVLIIFVGLYIAYFIGNTNKRGGEGGNVYTFYEGPVFPLSTLGVADGVSAERNINFDFMSYELSQQNRLFYANAGIVTDEYVLSNSTDEAIKVNLIYPFVGELSMNNNYFPKITVDGERAEVDFYAGDYTGSFEEDSQIPISSWEGYDELLKGNEYRTAAFDEFTQLTQKVYVYKISDYTYSKDAKASNPTLQMTFDVNLYKTTVLGINTSGGGVDSEQGRCAKIISGIEYNVNAPEGYQEPKDAYIIIVGEDIVNYALQGYADAGCKTGEELKDLSATVTKYESTLGEMLELAVEEYFDLYLPENVYSTQELLYGYAAELLCTHGLLSSSVPEYKTDELTELCELAYTMKRVMYFSFEAEVPADSSVEVVSKLYKAASRNIDGDGEKCDGYDMVTKTGSLLAFTEQSASLTNYGNIEILDQNFGFNLEEGITSVILDVKEKHYWMDIRQKVED